MFHIKCFFAVLLYIFTYTSVLCMMCMPEHPQTAFCRADFVIRAKVIKSSYRKETPAPTPIPPFIRLNENVVPVRKPNITMLKVDAMGMPIPETVTVHVFKVYKGGKLLNVSRDDVIQVDIQNPWQPTLISPGNYLLTGFVFNKRATVTMCNWYARWKDLTFVQHWGLKRYYNLNCKCRVSYCSLGEECERISPDCSWEVATYEIGTNKTDCKSRMGICMYMSKYKSCVWYNPKLPCTEPNEMP